jgi:hypothetical protein
VIWLFASLYKTWLLNLFHQKLQTLLTSRMTKDKNEKCMLDWYEVGHVKKYMGVISRPRKFLINKKRVRNISYQSIPFTEFL